MKVLRSKKTIDQVKRYNKLSLDIKKLETEKKELRENLLKLNEDKKADQFKAGDLLLNFKKSIRNIFNKKEYLKINGDESLNEYLNESESVTITIKKAA